MRLKNKKGLELLGENTVQLVIAVLCIVVLVYLGMALYDFFIGNKNAVKKAEFELKGMNAELESLSAEKTQGKYIATTAQNWWLFSEEYGKLCQGSFCLCLCDEKDCSGKSKACIATEKFVLIRGSSGKEERMIELTSPSELKMTASSEEAYPFNGGSSTTDYKVVMLSITPLFFKFDNEWKWSPDLINWMSTKTTIVSAGQWKGDKPAEENANLIDFMSALKLKSDQNAGEKLFNQAGLTKSKGVYIIQQ